jgi:4-hydroxymandelate oxidase
VSDAHSPSLLDRLDPRHYGTVARLFLPAPIAGWVDAGSDAPSDNEGAFEAYRLVPRVLRDVSAVRTDTGVLGATLRSPIGVAPIGIQKALHPEGELATVRGAARAGSLFIVPVNATTPIGRIGAESPGTPLWFQLYNWLDRDALASVLAEAEEAGATAIVPLVNTPLAVAHTPASIGFRLPAGVELAHGAGAQAGLDGTLDFSYLEWLASRTRLPIVPKGIIHPDDARRALDAGARAIIVSNHGNRQVARSVATLDALPGVVAAVGDRAEVYLDGGVRSGADVLVALALGACAVFVARPVCWGLAVGGDEGVARVLEALARELAEEAGMCGVADTTSVPRDLVVRVIGDTPARSA